MLDYFIEWTLKSKDEEKAVIHCSAGIGRTGTTVSLTHILIKLFAQKNMGVDDPVFSPLSTVRRLREHRNGFVQTNVQYLFIYYFMKSFVGKRLK